MQKKFMIAIGSVLILLGVVLGVYYFGSLSKVSPEQQVQLSPTLGVVSNIGDPVLNISYGQGGYAKLDVYPIKDAISAPVLVFVHGGSWYGGDKDNLRTAKDALKLFQKKGMIVVGVNFRLVSDKGFGENGVTYKEQVSDVAQSLEWVHKNIASYGGDPNRITLLGYSSGAHLVSLLGTDERYLKAEGLSLADIDAVMAFDVDAYDIPRAIAECTKYNYPAAEKNLPKYFSSDVDIQKEASPITYVRSGEKYPPFLLVYSGYGGGRPESMGAQTLSRRQSEVFAEALQNIGGSATVFGNTSFTHTELVMKLGQPDFSLTGVVETFLDQVLR